MNARAPDQKTGTNCRRNGENSTRLLMPSLSLSSFGPWVVTVPLAKVPVIQEEKLDEVTTVTVKVPGPVI